MRVRKNGDRFVARVVSRDQAHPFILVTNIFKASIFKGLEK